MGTLSFRIDSQTAAFVERTARERGLTKSEVVREALATLRERGKGDTRPPLSVRLAHIIGSVDTGGMQLSQGTGEKFARLLQEIKHAKRKRRRGSSRRR